MDEALLAEVVERVRGVDGICAVVLGGSRATGRHSPESDFDVGLFYRGSAGFDLAALGSVASALDDAHRPELVTPIGGWGPWVVGGGWLTIRSRAVDFIYRDIERVARVADECRSGLVELGYQPAYPNGFLSSTYMAELDACKILWDPSGELAALQRGTRPYPAELKRALFGKLGWEPEFAINAGRKTAPRADVAFAASHCAWAVASLCQLLFALNEQYCLNDKGAVAIADGFAQRPAGFRARVEEVFATLRAEPAAIRRAFELLESLARDVKQLCAETR